MQPRSPMHGAALDEAEELLLRSRPPGIALDWVAAAVGRGSVVTAVRPLFGGSSSAVHELTVSEPDGRTCRLILRRYVRSDWLEEQPDLAEREAEVLRLLEPTRLPTPRLVAVDATGALAAAPAVLMSALPGRIDWAEAAELHGLRTMAELLAQIHTTTVPADSHVRAYRPAYQTAQLVPPTGTSRRKLWERAFSLYDDPPAPAGPVLIHRDYHPGNVLWSGAHIVGIVDWATSSRGDPAADVGHCRANLTEFGLEIPELFLRLCRQAGVCADYNPYWDLAAAVDVGHWADEPDPVLESWLSAAVAALSA